MQSNRLRLVLGATAALLFVIFLSANGIAGLYTDWLWFDNLDQSTIWTTVLGTKMALVGAFSGAFFLLLWGNLLLAERLRPELRALTPEDDLVVRYHQMVGSQGAKVRLVVSALFALVAGANTSAQWENWLLFRNAQSFGREVPVFGRDAGFYVFRLPFISFFVSWLFAAVILTLIVVLIAHYLNGGVRASAPSNRVSPGVKLQVSGLLAVLAVLRAVAYWVDRYALVRSTRGAFDGALATDVIIQEPALRLLALISLACAVLFLVNIGRPGWGLPMIAIGIWLVSHFVVGNVFPVVYQRLRVVPAQSQREAPYVANNISATRFAYGLDEDSVTVVPVNYEASFTSDDADAYDDVLRNVPLVDYELAYEEFIKSEAERKTYSFTRPLDVDRYEIGGEVRPVIVSARGLNNAQLGQDWEPQHVIFTHGYGAAMAAAYDGSEALAPGESQELDFLVRGLGSITIDDGLDISLEQPRIYFGDSLSGYAIVGANRDEVDYQDGDNSVLFRYDGPAGVPMGSLMRRIAFALRFREPDPLVSGSLTSDSRVIYRRDVEERVRELAPFLSFDADPQPVLAEGRLWWVLDGYTTSDSYPYSQSALSSGLPTSADLAGGYNYVRNAVKVVIDAYSGEVSVYVIDDEDPILQAWREVFPGLFTDLDDLPASIEAHLKYPKDLFVVQTEMWSRYQVEDATEFIQGDLAWEVASQPSTEAQSVEASDPTASVRAPSMKPQYLTARIPGEDESEFVLQRAFVPQRSQDGVSRPELTALMMARSDPGHYGELVLVRLTGATNVNAPDRVHSEIRKNDELTEFIRTKVGANVQFGEMSIVLVDETIVFVRPVYVESNAETAVPELQRIVAVNGDRIVLASTLQAALAGVQSDRAGDQASETDDNNSAGRAPSVYEAGGKGLVEILADVEELLSTAGALEDSNPAEAARLREEARLALSEARDLLGGAPAGSSSGP